MLKLYHFGDSLCSIKVRYALEEKGLDYEGQFVDLMRFENLDPGYLKLNPNGVVPTIDNDGRVVIESTVINEYVDDVFDGPALKPADPYERARMRIFTKMQDDVVHPAIQKPTFNLLVKPLLQQMSPDDLDTFTAKHPHEANRQLFRNAAEGPVDQEAIEGAKERFRMVFGRMSAALEQGEWLAGNTFSLADIAIAPAVDRLDACGLFELFEEFPKVADWAKRIQARPAFQRARPKEEQRLRNFSVN